MIGDARYETIATFSLMDTGVPCKVVDVCDGDTVWIAFKHGDSVCKTRARLSGINAPEIDTPEGMQSKQRLIELITGCLLESNTVKERKTVRNVMGDLSPVLVADIHAFDKYGRVLVTLHKDDMIINDVLVQENHAQPYT